MNTFNDLLNDLAHVLKKHDANIQLSESPSEIAIVISGAELYIDCGSPVTPNTLIALAQHNPQQDKQLSWIETD